MPLDTRDRRSFGATYLRNWASAREGKCRCEGGPPPSVAARGEARVTTVESGHTGASLALRGLRQQVGSSIRAQ
jgi:hypothetical protein